MDETRRGEPVALVVRALGLGDLLTAVPALRGIAGALPQHRVVLAAPEWLRAVVDLLEGVDELMPVAGIEALVPAYQARFATAPLDLAVNLHGRGPQSHAALLRLQPRALIAYAHQGVSESATGPHWHPVEHEVDRWCRLVSHAGWRCDPSALALTRPEWPAATPRRAAWGPGATIVHIGASHDARRWPPQRFAALADALRQAGHRLIVTGSAAERIRAKDVVAGAGLEADADAAGVLPLAALCRLVADARVVISGDTGVAHLATAFGTPSVVLFGPVSPALWGPPLSSRHRVLWMGRTGAPNASRPSRGLLEISVAAVLRAVDDVDRACPD